VHLHKRTKSALPRSLGAAGKDGMQYIIDVREAAAVKLSANNLKCSELIVRARMHIYRAKEMDAAMAARGAQCTRLALLNQECSIASLCICETKRLADECSRESEHIICERLDRMRAARAMHSSYGSQCNNTQCAPARCHSSLSPALPVAARCARLNVQCTRRLKLTFSYQVQPC
jgi:hypothetical protein